MLNTLFEYSIERAVGQFAKGCVDVDITCVVPLILYSNDIVYDTSL